MKRIGRTFYCLTVLVLLLLSIGCKKSDPEGYRVLSYDSLTHQWTILRTGTFSNGDGNPPSFLRKRITMVCSLYHWADKEVVKGPDACHLQVGRLIVPNPFPGQGKRQDFVDVFEMPDEVISITEGEGPDQVIQQFNIVKYEVLPDKKD